MKKYFKYLIALIIFFPFSVYAECDLAELNSKKNLIRNINWTYEYYLEGNSMYFDITVVNVYDDLYVKDLKTNKTYNNKEFIIKKVSDNQKLNFEIYSKNCNELITTKKLTLPAYNSYYGMKYCEGISEFDLCHKWGLLSSSVNIDVLKKQTDEYREQLNAKIEEKTIIYETKITGFYMFIILFILIISFIFMAIIRGKVKKDFV